MKIYQVGGAVRDRLLGRRVKERDWLVVGSTPGEMEALGYRPVGRDFPVFLHPKTGEEYALARTERKTGPGYHGFKFQVDPGVTLEEDLARRDLTINAMAEDESGRIYDPYGGQKDLKARLLRHVSPAFREDPVRILRLARFAARYAPLGFRIAPGTVALMRKMVVAGEADHLVPERVWKELERALAESCPDVFIRVLRDCHALARVMPEVDRLFGVPQPGKYHPEIDTGVHVLMALRQAVGLQADPMTVFSVLMHDLGKGVTAGAQWPRHIGHEARGVPLVEVLCARLGAPRAWREQAILVTREHLNIHRVLELRPATLLDLLGRLDAWRRPRRFRAVLQACEADARGRKGYEEVAYPQRTWLETLQSVTHEVRVDTVGIQGPAIARALNQARLAAIRGILDKKPGASTRSGSGPYRGGVTGR